MSFPKRLALSSILGLGLWLPGCLPVAAPAHPGADEPIIDRFSAAAGKLQVRTADNGLPRPNQPVDFDRPPFITQSRGPGGELIRYYNFDVRSTTPASLYVFFLGKDRVPGQRDVVDVIPGSDGYNDFFRVIQVQVPTGYTANQLRDLASIRRSGFELQETAAIVNRPIVPHGSTARERLHGAPTAPELGWYRGHTVEWLRFDETGLSAGPKEPVPTSPIYVTFNKNPGEPGGGPPSGFVTEPGGVQTHNVASSLPGDLDYSPLWLVSFYDNAAFPRVSNEATVLAAPMKARNVATVNCPVVFIQPR